MAGGQTRAEFDSGRGGIAVALRNVGGLGFFGRLDEAGKKRDIQRNRTPVQPG